MFTRHYDTTPQVPPHTAASLLPSFVGARGARGSARLLYAALRQWGRQGHLNHVARCTHCQLTVRVLFHLLDAVG